jgi:diadenosine tetraphosphatase ApaH/serine/threonine PP2A family protein phosphatase
MKYAIFADIHGNLEALEVALEYAQKRGLSRFIVLGDSVGYGANPNECLEWALGNAGLHILGNHEAAVIHEKVRLDFSNWARIAIQWTAERLRPEMIEKIKDLPYLQREGEVALAHGTLHAPEQFHYLLEPTDAHKSFMAFREKFGFVGHTHIPSFFTEKEQTLGYLKEGVHPLKKGERYLLNPGSVGQPRDRDLRLSFGIFDPEELMFEIVRLPYNNKKAAQKILAAGLPRFLAERLIS